MDLKILIVLILVTATGVLGQDASTTSTTIKPTTKSTRRPPRPTPPSSPPPAFNETEFQYGHFCVCDLTEGACDVNCCCDTNDCSNEDMDSFSQCVKIEPHKFNDRYCYNSDFLVENNTHYLLEVSNDNALFCIIDDNLEGAFTFLELEATENITDFETLKSRHKAFVWPRADARKSVKAINKAKGLDQDLEKKKANGGGDNDKTKNNTTKSYYAGDPILSYHGDEVPSGHFEPLSLPMAINSRDCSVFSPIKYMEDKRTECQRYLHNSMDSMDCREVPELNAAMFVNDVHVVKTPSKIGKNETNGIAVKIEAQTCINLNSEQVCTPTSEPKEPTKSCENVMTGLTYEIHHNGTEGIDRVVALITYTNYAAELDASESPIVITQTFQYVHLWPKEKTANLFHRSGNPGYQLGKPILSGLLRPKDPSSLSSGVGNPGGAGTGSSPTGLPPPSAPGGSGGLIQTSQPDWYIDRTSPEVEAFQFLTIMDPGFMTSAECPQDNGPMKRSKILFGENMRVGCHIKVTRGQLSDQCDEIKNQTVNMLVGDLGSNNEDGLFWDFLDPTVVDDPLAPLHWLKVATFGNLNTTNTNGWVQIILSGAPTPHGQGNRDSTVSSYPFGTCSGVILSLNVEVAFANVGSQANPQPKIIGVKYDFGLPQDITFKCSGLKCRKNRSTQDLEVSTSVSFVDKTQPALAYYAEKPVLEAKLPHDFFYPFV